MASTPGNHVVVKVFLYGIKPQIWRRFSISDQATFLELHNAIQVSMGWENLQPHEFRHGKGKRLVDVIGPIGLQGVIGEFQDETQVTLADYIGKKKLPMRLLYRYDFADEWIHEIVFEKKIAEESVLPKILGGERASPPEDFGGHFQYMQALHGEIGWMNPGYEPEKFEPEKVDFTPRKERKRR